MNRQNITLLSLLGPTASGKTALALEIAEAINGEIISCDSMQVYRGMDIGTAKATEEERQRIPHHLIDILDITEFFSASHFVEKAETAISDIVSRNKVPILTGGTGLYARLLLYGGCMLPADREIAKNVRQNFTDKGHQALIDELHAIDPQTAERVGTNVRRLYRALEAVRLTKKPLPGKINWGDENLWGGQQIILVPAADTSRQLIAQRTAKMLESGWIEETEKLVALGLLDTPTAFQSLGYREIASYLQGGFPSKDALLEKLITLTCRYAKRQRTWFRHQHPGAQIINAENKDDMLRQTKLLKSKIISQFPS